MTHIPCTSPLLQRQLPHHLQRRQQRRVLVGQMNPVLTLFISTTVMYFFSTTSGIAKKSLYPHI